MEEKEEFLTEEELEKIFQKRKQRAQDITQESEEKKKRLKDLVRQSK